MGTWGTDVFANDAAMDWIDALEDADDIGVVEIALSAVNSSGGYLEATECCIALAAAEVVATILKRPGPEVPSEVFEWIARVGRAMPASLPADARSAIDRVASGSELLELWEEAGDPGLTEWRAALADVRGRLE